jgi:hypothetical protein
MNGGKRGDPRTLKSCWSRFPERSSFASKGHENKLAALNPVSKFSLRSIVFKTDEAEQNPAGIAPVRKFEPR